MAQIVLIKPHSNGGVSGKACEENLSLGRQFVSLILGSINLALGHNNSRDIWPDDNSCLVS